MKAFVISGHTGQARQIDINEIPQKKSGEEKMKYISLVFEEDLQRDDIERLKTVKGCLGVSAFKNTVNLYFRHIDHATIHSLTLAVQAQLVTAGTQLALTNAILDARATRANIYEAIRDEVIA